MSVFRHVMPGTVGWVILHFVVVVATFAMGYFARFAG